MSILHYDLINPDVVNDRNEMKEIISIIKDVQREFKQQIEEDNTIDKTLLLQFKKLFNDFTYSLFEYIRYQNKSLVGITDGFDSKGEDIEVDKYEISAKDTIDNLEAIISTWNKLVIFLISRLKYNELEPQNKLYIDNKFSKLISDKPFEGNDEGLLNYVFSSLEKSMFNATIDYTDKGKFATLGGEIFNPIYDIIRQIETKHYNIVSFKRSLGYVEEKEEDKDEANEEERRRQLDELQRQIDDAQRERDEAERERDEAQRRLDEAEQDMDAIRENAERDLQDAVNEGRDIIDRLQRQIDDAQRQRQIAEIQFTDIAKELERTQKEMKGRTETEKESLAKVMRDWKQSEDEYKKLIDQITKDKDKDNKDSEKKIKDINARLRGTESKIETMKQRLKESEDLIKDLNNTIKQKDKDLKNIPKLKKDLEDLTDERKQYEGIIEDLNKQLREKDSQTREQVEGWKKAYQDIINIILNVEGDAHGIWKDISQKVGSIGNPYNLGKVYLPANVFKYGRS